MKVSSLPANTILQLQGEAFLLLPRALWWESQSALILSDLHLAGDAYSDSLLAELRLLIQNLLPVEIILLGDLFAQLTPKVISNWLGLTAFSAKINWQLVVGNHDVQLQQEYRQLGIGLHSHLVKSGFAFHHSPLLRKSLINEVNFVFAGHIHPAIYNSDTRTQQACFWLQQDQQLILPAFHDKYAKLTIAPQKRDSVFVIK